MRVLDLGSGAGDVCFVLARLVGPEGRVIGLDHDASVVEHARERAAEEGFSNIEFVACELADFAPAEPVDAVVGRFVLLYQTNPSAALASVVRHVRPGGIVAFQELWMQPGRGPDSNIMRAATCLMETMRRSGAHLDAGPRLHRIFSDAGLPIPHMRSEQILDGNPGSPLSQLFVDTLESLLPKAIEYGLAKEGDFDLATMPAKIEAELQFAGYPMFSAPNVMAWCRTS
jgi:cyclopropane fatty-acyl-phospholipid synthase-like methyltransferase